MGQDHPREDHASTLFRNIEGYTQRQDDPAGNRGGVCPGDGELIEPLIDGHGRKHALKKRLKRGSWS